MVENKECKGCPYNNYPTCSAIIMFDGNEMNIENLRETFKCGRKDVVLGDGEALITDFSLNKSHNQLEKDELEATKADFEARIVDLEAKTAALEAEKT